MKQFWKMSLVAALAFPAVNYAEVISQFKTIVVMQPQDLPQAAQATGQSMALHSLSNGLTYLYIEQQQLGQLAILDVTDPAHIKQVGSVRLDASETFDFGAPVNDSAVMIHFRSAKGSAVLDLRKPKQPTLSAPSAFLPGTDTEHIGKFGLLLVNNPESERKASEQDFSIVDTSNSGSPRLLDTVKNVQQELVNEDTGTTYLLGADGLTVVRRPSVELDHHLISTYTN